MIKVSKFGESTGEKEPFCGSGFLKRPNKKHMTEQEYFEYLNSIFVDPHEESEKELTKKQRLQWLFHQKGFYEGNGLHCGDYSPVRLIEAFIVCQELNIYPPLWVLDGLAEKFKKYFNPASKGCNVKLDDYIGLKKPLFRERKQMSIKWALVKDVIYLNHFFGISIENACGFVAEKFRANRPRSGNFFDVKDDIKSETIEKWYKQTKGNVYLNQFQVNGPHTLSAEESERFLGQFPDETRERILQKSKK